MTTGTGLASSQPATAIEQMNETMRITVPISSRFSMGVASRNDSVYFAWQDSRNGSRETQSEDVYTSSLLFDDVTGASDSAGVPGWLLLGAGLAGGMALSIVIAWALARRTSGDAAPAPSRA